MSKRTRSTYSPEFRLEVTTENCIQTLVAYKTIWTNGSRAITMIELIRGRCAAGEYQPQHYLMGKRFGLKRI